MQDIAVSIKKMSQNIAPSDDLGAMLDVLNQHHELTPIQKLNISKYLALPANKNQAILFQKLGEVERKAWLTCRLVEITHNAAAKQWPDVNMQVDI
ncbi:hypothetical protein J3R83DRAFT_7820 [Lanmaoa asiatica]|nr:hypothetical protein J3R83DRAFT_7820 [Lanmaoa asiatica]